MADLEFTVKQAARELGVTPRTVRNWCSTGRLVGKKKPGKYGPRWLISADDVRRKRVEGRAELGRGRGGGDGSVLVLGELRSLREELAAYREHLERLTIIIQRQLPAAPPQPPWYQRAWGWLRGGE